MASTPHHETRSQMSVEAAVLVPLLRQPEGQRLVLIARQPGGLYGDQLAFPGGKREPTDETLADTAIREAAEETGLDPALVQILAELPLVEGQTTGVSVAPFLGRIQRPDPWRPQTREVIEVVEVAVSALVAPDARKEAAMEFSTWEEPRLTSYLSVGDHRVWGLTLRILDPLLPRLAAGEWS